MKKIILLIVLFVFSGGVAFAQELGNPAKLIPQGQFAVGIQGNWVFKQAFEDYDLKKTYSDGYKPPPDRQGSDFEGDQYYMATITYGLIDRINLFCKLGIVDGGKWTDTEPGDYWKADLGSGFVWAIGAKGKVYEFANGIGFAAAAQYLRYDNRTVKNWRSLKTGQTAREIGWVTDDQIDYWQVDAIANVYWTLGRFTPYVGAGYSYYNVDYKGRWDHEVDWYGWVDYEASFSNENRFSALVGVDVDLGKNFKANVQGTFVSRSALTIGLSYSF
ncbi:MAG: hypothetical protein V1689_16305 [Pseudomonadota bacterium]